MCNLLRGSADQRAAHTVSGSPLVSALQSPGVACEPGVSRQVGSWHRWGGDCFGVGEGWWGLCGRGGPKEMLHKWGCSTSIWAVAVAGVCMAPAGLVHFLGLPGSV